MMRFAVDEEEAAMLIRCFRFHFATPLFFFAVSPPLLISLSH